MSSSTAFCIEAVVDDAERPALVATSEQLTECLLAASGSRPEIRLEFANSLDHDRRASTGNHHRRIAAAGRYRDEPIPSVEARWRRQLGTLTTLPVFLCTVFRHVPRHGVDRPENRPAIIERIRRLNLLAVELSHDSGAAVIDIDRAFAHLGARVLAADYRLRGVVAAEVAAHTIAGSLLAVGLDDIVAAEVLERATQFQGAPWQIGDLLARRKVQRR
jgi:hypothetical protein